MKEQEEYLLKQGEEFKKLIVKYKELNQRHKMNFDEKGDWGDE